MIVSVKTSNTSINAIYEDLAIAIIVTAANDYRKVLKQLKKNPFDVYSLVEKRKIEDFFHSEWYACLTNVDGEMILRRLKNGE